MNTTAIQLRDVHKHFPSAGGLIRAVDGISLTIEQGEIVALLGTNGAGKTTALDMVLGLTKPTSGEVSVLGGTPTSAIHAGRISAVLQTGGLLGDLKVEETVQLIAAMYANHAPIEDVMERAGLTGIAKQMVSKCSGGEQQRLRFALALLPEPDIIVLDEPTAGMDVNARAAFWDAMHEEAARGRTVVFATHYLHEAEQFANRIVMMNRGRIIADGSVAEVRKLAGKRRIAVRWPDVSDQQLTQLPEHEVVQREGEAITFAAVDSDGLARYLLTHTPAFDLTITAASLDEAFSHLVEVDGSDKDRTELEGSAR